MDIRGHDERRVVKTVEANFLKFLIPSGALSNPRLGIGLYQLGALHDGLLRRDTRNTRGDS